jgi:uncharacterized protein (DUF1015 family)
MAEIRPFRGIRYDKERVKIDDVVTQPYDKITSDMQSSYYDRSPHSVARIIRNRETDPYASANKCFREWLSEGVLVRDVESCIYPYFQEYGQGRVRKGFVALLKLEEFSAGVVLPHERTFSAAKKDRLDLLRATEANFGQIFMLYSDPNLKIQKLIDDRIEKDMPLMDVRESYEQDACHKLWRISDSSVIGAIQDSLKNEPVLIADGHHRYETALNYSKENSSAQYRMVTLVSLEDPGLMVLPTHRAIYGIEIAGFMDRAGECFEIERCETKESLVSSLKGKKHHYGVYDGNFWLLKLKDENLIDKYGEKGKADEYKSLDVTVLHNILLENVLRIPREKLLNKECVDYIRDIDNGVRRVDAGKYQLLFMLNPTRVDEVRDISAKREVMPQKSTDFYPKLITGLVMYGLE